MTDQKKNMDRYAVDGYVTQLVDAFWDNRLDADKQDKFAGLLRKWIPEIPDDIDSATVIGNLKRHPFTGEKLDDLIFPYGCQMVYDGSCKDHPFGNKMIEAFEPDTFAGPPPKDHPAPHLFANKKPHVYLPKFGPHGDRHMTFRFCETGEDLVEREMGDDELNACKNYALLLLAEGKDDVGIYKDGKQLKHPGEEVVEQVRSIIGKKRSRE